MNILLIKLGALGDVLRTTPLLTGLQKKYPGCRISWLVDPAHRSVLQGNSSLAALHSLDASPKPDWAQIRYDLAINLDKEPEALDAMAKTVAAKKMGFIGGPKGSLTPADSLSEYAYRLGVDDELKFRQNKKSYQEISFEQAGLNFAGEEYLFEVDEESRRFARAHLKEMGVPEKSRRPLIGINTGAGRRFAGKKLPAQTCARMAELFAEDCGAIPLLLGGDDEAERNRWIHERVPQALDTGSHSIRRFAALVESCRLVVSGDTTAMHIAIAVKTPVLAYFASTCSAEIELYGRGKKIVSEIECSPCYKRICPIDEQCMKDMRPVDFVREAKSWLESDALRLS